MKALGISMCWPHILHVLYQFCEFLPEAIGLAIGYWDIAYLVSNLWVYICMWVEAVLDHDVSIWGIKADQPVLLKHSSKWRKYSTGPPIWMLKSMTPWRQHFTYTFDWGDMNDQLSDYLWFDLSKAWRNIKLLLVYGRMMHWFALILYIDWVNVCHPNIYIYLFINSNLFTPYMCTCNGKKINRTTEGKEDCTASRLRNKIFLCRTMHNTNN